VAKRIRFLAIVHLSNLRDGRINPAVLGATIIRRILSGVILAVDTLLVLLSMFSLVGMESFSEQSRFRPGLIFADVEILAIIVLFLGVLTVRFTYCSSVFVLGDSYWHRVR
jgi:hypothetical protein